MNKLGIYFGPNSINFTETNGKKLVNNVQVPFLEASDIELEGKVPLEIKLVALINEALRSNRIEAKEASLALSGRDLIIRGFEMPDMPKDEMASAVRFEAKKYIPFKVEELISDFQAQADRSSRINNVLFMGLKKDMLDRYLSVFSQVNIKIRRLEYSGFSIIRALKLSGARENGVIGILCADFAGNDEANFVVLENGFPLFNRDINLSLNPQVPSGLDNAESQPQVFIDKLKSEIRVSLGYYQRKFPGKGIQRIFSFVNHDRYQELDSFMSELSIPSKLVDFSKLAGNDSPYSSGFLKGYSVSLADVVTTKVKINLTEIKALPKKAIISGPKLDLGTLIKDVKLDPRAVIAGLLICSAVFAYGIYRLAPLKQELNSVISKRVKVEKIDVNLSSDQLKEISAGYKKKLKDLDALIRKQFYATEALDSIPRCIPDGVWLIKFSLNKDDAKKMLLLLEGRSYLRSSDKEFEAVNKFVDNLKNDAALSKYFTEVELTSIDQGSQDKVTLTKFTLTCKNYKDGK